MSNKKNHGSARFRAATASMAALRKRRSNRLTRLRPATGPASRRKTRSGDWGTLPGPVSTRIQQPGGKNDANH